MVLYDKTLTQRHNLHLPAVESLRKEHYLYLLCLGMMSFWQAIFFIFSSSTGILRMKKLQILHTCELIVIKFHTGFLPSYPHYYFSSFSHSCFLCICLCVFFPYLLFFSSPRILLCLLLSCFLFLNHGSKNRNI